MNFKTLLTGLASLCIPIIVNAQDSSKVKTAEARDTTKSENDLMSQLENSGHKKNKKVNATFKYTRIINGHSIENLRAHVLDLRISHRFGPISSGPYNFFGLDNATMRLGFDYGISNNIMIGIGHSTYQKTYDAFLKIKIANQSSGIGNMPVTISFVPTIALNSLRPDAYPVKLDSGTQARQLSYVFQLLIARKFSQGFSLQLMPTYIHADNISFFHSKPNVFALGIAASQKLSRHMSISAEYYYQLPKDQAPLSHNVLSFGIDIGTGGHVFQLHFTNSNGLTEKSFITETTGRWDKSDILFGFNISRVFQLKKKHSKMSLPKS